ncbi:hypothetical protein PG985_012069 [Apiospora marii]|uniref:Uncharacterized protein n=1 Tax=Apiospora marii TaxID=335849 RepID=A0ABR1REE6_9PEZI
MIHTSEPEAENNFKALRKEVEAAKLQDLHAHVMAPKPGGPLDLGMQPWLMDQLRELVQSIHWYQYPDDPSHAAMALFHDGTFVAESQGSDSDRIVQIYEKQ